MKMQRGMYFPLADDGTIPGAGQTDFSWRLGFDEGSRAKTHGWHPPDRRRASLVLIGRRRTALAVPSRRAFSGAGDPGSLAACRPRAGTVQRLQLHGP